MTTPPPSKNKGMASPGKSTVQVGVVRDGVEAQLPPRKKKKSWQEREREVDHDMLRQAVGDAGRWAFGIVAVEVWVLDPKSSRLRQPRGGGLWIRPCHFHHAPPSSAAGKAMRRLTDTMHPNYVSPTSVAPGVGLAGALWSEAPTSGGGGGGNGMMGGGMAMMGRAGSSRSLPRQTTSQQSQHSHPYDEEDGNRHPPLSMQHHHSNSVFWRNIRALWLDPDQPHSGPRLELFVESGFEWAAGVPFVKGSVQGIILYMARRNVEPARLVSHTNENYLLASTDLVASVAAIRTPRRMAVAERAKERVAILRRVRRKILEIVRDPPRRKEFVARLEQLANSDDPIMLSSCGSYHYSGSNTNKPMSAAMPFDASNLEDEHHMATIPAGMQLEILKKMSSQKRMEQEMTQAAGAGMGGDTAVKVGCFASLQKQMALYAKKLKGSNLPPPPPMNTHQSAITFTGSIITLLMISYLSETLSNRLGEHHALVMPPFGALMSLQYSLVAAPATQPRNIIVGQAISMLIGLIFAKQLPMLMPTWVRTAVVPSVSVALMARMGCIHPPAAASALLFSTGRFSWPNMLWTLSAQSICIVTAVVINNMSEKRQYPTYWFGASSQDFLGQVMDYCTCFLISGKKMLPKRRKRQPQAGDKYQNMSELEKMAAEHDDDEGDETDDDDHGRDPGKLLRKSTASLSERPRHAARNKRKPIV